MAEVIAVCGRYSLAPEDSMEIEKIIRQVQEKIKTGEIYPTNRVPVLVEAGSELVPEVAEWGFPRFQGKSGSIINARSETAAERPMFRKSLAERRCVIPTTGFFEWGAGIDGKKQKYRFNMPNDRALYLAGLWNDFSGERRCVILTTAGNASMSGIHDRMPVLLKEHELRQWVGGMESVGEILSRVPPALVHEEAQ